MPNNINLNRKRLPSERTALKKQLSEKSKVRNDDKTPIFTNSRYNICDYKGIGYVSVAEKLGF